MENNYKQGCKLKHLRINIYGGPGCGKSTVASSVFSYLKSKDYSIEMVPEYVKFWAYMDRKIESFDQLYLLAKQIYKEDSLHRFGVQYTITDCPILICVVYAKLYNFIAWEELISICKKFEEIIPSINIFLERPNILYKQNGRYETYDQALIVDNEIKSVLNINCIKYTEIDYLVTDVAKYIENEINTIN